jgi:hypothetical protein
MFPRPSSAVETIKLYFFSSPDTKSAGCPYTTIGLLTGEDPWQLRVKYKSKPTMTANVMVKHLRSVGFKTTEITKDLSLKYLKARKCFTNSHVILATVRMTAHESSWVVFYGGVMWHNFEPISTSYITSLTFPIINAFVLFLPEWDYCEIKSVRKARFLEEAELYRDISKRYGTAAENSNSIHNHNHEKPTINNLSSGDDIVRDNDDNPNKPKRNTAARN